MSRLLFTVRAVSGRPALRAAAGAAATVTALLPPVAAARASAALSTSATDDDTAAVRIGPPHPEWTPGQPQPAPFEGGHVALDLQTLATCYPLMISAYVPRPIALISSRSASGVGNVAPFSYSGVVSHDPPAIAISICRQVRHRSSLVST